MFSNSQQIPSQKGYQLVEKLYFKMTSDNLKEFAKRLRYYLYSRNISVEQFARRLGYTGPDPVQKALNAENHDVTELLFKMAKNFDDVNFNFLIKGTRLTEWERLQNIMSKKKRN